MISLNTYMYIIELLPTLEDTCSHTPVCLLGTQADGLLLRSFCWCSVCRNAGDDGGWHI